MALTTTPIFLSTFLLDRNRFSNKGPSIEVSQWIESIAEAGFKGIEIWLPHLHLASRSEWDALRDALAEVDLPIQTLLAHLPADNSDKVLRLLDTVRDACEYFHPPQMKFTLGSPARKDGKWDKHIERLQILAPLLRDLPRDLRLIKKMESATFDTNEIEAVSSVLGKSLAWSVNPFLPQIEAWYPALKGRLVDLDIALEDKGKFLSVTEKPELTATLFSIPPKLGFEGSWTLSHTKGCGEGKEDPYDLHDQAEADFDFLANLFVQLQG